MVGREGRKKKMNSEKWTAKKRFLNFCCNIPVMGTGCQVEYEYVLCNHAKVPTTLNATKRPSKQGGTS